MKKWLKITCISLTCLVLVSVAGFYFYVSDYYRAESLAVSAISKNTTVVDGNLTILKPESPGDRGFIFYPGGKVEHTAYLPLLEQLRQNGITCVLVKMPFQLAVFDPDAAKNVFENFPEIKNWYIGGHSLGGAMASDYASKNPERISGLVLLGAYLYGDFPAERSLTIYGSEDKVMNRTKLTYTENVAEIQGGNHAQFGSYGSQKGDGTPTITPEKQQSETAELIIDFIRKLSIAE